MLDRLLEFPGSNRGTVHALVDFDLFHLSRFTHGTSLEEWQEKIQGFDDPD
jgi:hypothetical protein